MFESVSTVTRNVCQHQVGYVVLGRRKTQSQRDYLIYVSTTSCNRNDLLYNKMIISIVTVDNVGKARNDWNGLTL